MSRTELEGTLRTFLAHLADSMRWQTIDEAVTKTACADPPPSSATVDALVGAWVERLNVAPMPPIPPGFTPAEAIRRGTVGRVEDGEAVITETGPEPTGDE